MVPPRAPSYRTLATLASPADGKPFGAAPARPVAATHVGEPMVPPRAPSSRSLATLASPGDGKPFEARLCPAFVQKGGVE